MKLGRNVQDNDLGSLLWAFVREKSGSLIIHENSFWPFFAFFLTLVTRIDLISHMVVVLNVSQHMAVVIGHA